MKGRGLVAAGCVLAALLVVPNTGHAVNLEEPAAFNAACADFLAQVDADRWPMRHPRAMSESITGVQGSPAKPGS